MTTWAERRVLIEWAELLVWMMRVERSGGNGRLGKEGTLCQPGKMPGMVEKGPKPLQW